MTDEVTDEEQQKLLDEPTTIMPMIDGRYFIGVWFLYGKENRDWMCSVWRDKPTDTWKIRWRFRYYSDPPSGPWDGKDKRSHYAAEVAADVSEDELKVKINLMVRGLMEMGFNTKSDFVPLHTDNMDKVHAQMKTRSWCHIKQFKVTS